MPLACDSVHVVWVELELLRFKSIYELGLLSRKEYCGLRNTVAAGLKLILCAFSDIWKQSLCIHFTDILRRKTT